MQFQDNYASIVEGRSMVRSLGEADSPCFLTIFWSKVFLLESDRKLRIIVLNNLIWKRIIKKRIESMNKQCVEERIKKYSENRDTQYFNYT